MSYLDNTGNRRSNCRAGLPPPPPYDEALIKSTISDHSSSQHSNTDDHSQSSNSHSSTFINSSNNAAVQSEHTNSNLQTFINNRTTPKSAANSPSIPSPHNSHLSSGVSYDSSTIIQELQRTVKELQLQLALKEIQQSRTVSPTLPMFQPWPPNIPKQVQQTDAATSNTNPHPAPHYTMRMPHNPYTATSYNNTTMKMPPPTTYMPSNPILPSTTTQRVTDTNTPMTPTLSAPPVIDLLDFTQMPTTSTNTHVPNHMYQPNSNVNHPQPMQMVTQFKPLTFRQLKDNNSLQAYKIWKSLCHLEISVHSDFTNIIHKSPNGQLSITGQLTEMQSHSIYLATAKAIGESILKVVDPYQTSLGKGQELWAAIDDYYLSNSNTNLLKHETLRDDLKAITKNTNETFQNYALRYSEKLALLHHHNVTDAPNGATLAYRLIRGLCLPNIFKPVLKDINSGSDTTWYKSSTNQRALTCIQIIKKAQEYYDMDVNFSQSSKPTPRPRPNQDPPITPRPNQNRNNNNGVPSGQNQRNNNPNTPSNQNQRNNNPTTPRGRPTNNNDNTPPTSLPTEAENFKTHLSTSNNILGELYAKNAQFHDCCPFHTRQDHTFLTCFSLTRICRELNCSANLREIKSVLGITNTTPTTPQANQNDATTNAQDGPNTPSSSNGSNSNNGN